MSKKIVIINGHPNPDSFNFGVAEEYKKTALANGNQVDEIVLTQMDFDPILRYGFQKRMDLEPDLLEAWDKIIWADHLVWIHPVWWGGMPALMKGFIDRLFLPGMAFKYRENSNWWDKLLTGKTARIITSLDQPSWYYRWINGRPSINQLKKTVLEFCGIKVTGITYLEMIRNSDETKRKKLLEKVTKAALKD